VEQALEAADRPLLLQSAAELEQALDAWSAAPVLGIDTEFVRERTYRADLGLVQVSDGHSAWLWDPLAFDSPAPVAAMFEATGCVKVLHSGSEDLEVALHALGALPRPLVDTQVACAMAGQPLQLSYQGAVKWLFDVEIDKEHTRSNWCRRPLQPGQLHYAAMDVVLLPLMYRELRSKLDALGRWAWLEEDVERMLQAATVDVEPDEAWLRINGANRLDDAGLRTLQALARWRENTAVARNRARGFVVKDADLLELARSRPGSAAALRAAVSLHPRALDRYAGDLLQAIAEAEGSAAEPPRIEPLNNAQRRQLDRMKDAVQARAAELSVDPALLASRRELERLLRSAAAAEAPPERFLGWRKAVITDELLQLIG